MELNDKCSICLEDMNKYHIKELSCGHKIHFKCFLDISMRKNFFIECPLCRHPNNNVEKPHEESRKNLIEFISNKDKNGMKRCKCKTKDGKICKNKSKIMNYGMCHIHNKFYLNENLYPLMDSYLNIILQQRGGIETKILLFDMGKKIIMKYCDENSTVADIFSKYYEFYSIELNNGDTIVKEYCRFYDYYKIKRPDKVWLEECRDKFIFF
jgi:hypothetical protein